jgi:hypothetical protein
MPASKAPDTIDAESFASNLTLVKSLFPTMPEASVRRISWQIAKSRASLADAAKEEGYSLDGTTAPLAAVRKPAPPVAPTPAQVAELADLRLKIRALRGPSPASAAAVTFPAEADHVGTFPPGYDAKSMAAHKAAMRLVSVIPGMKYKAALAAVALRNK